MTGVVAALATLAVVITVNVITYRWRVKMINRTPYGEAYRAGDRPE